MKIKVAFQKKDIKPSLLDNIVASSIKIWTKSKYYHVAVRINGVWYTSTPMVGVNSNPIEESNFDIIEIEHFALGLEEMDIAMRYIENQMDCAYDWKGILLSQFLSFGINSDTKWFCSEIVTKILQLMYVEEVFDVTPNKVSPQRLYELLGGLK